MRWLGRTILPARPAWLQGRDEILALLETMQAVWGHPEGQHALAVAVRRIRGMPDHGQDASTSPDAGAER